MLLTKYECMVCGRVTSPTPESSNDVVQTEKDICDECKEAIMFAREMLSKEYTKAPRNGRKLLKSTR